MTSSATSCRSRSSCCSFVHPPFCDGGTERRTEPSYRASRVQVPARRPIGVEPSARALGPPVNPQSVRGERCSGKLREPAAGSWAGTTQTGRPAAYRPPTNMMYMPLSWPSLPPRPPSPASASRDSRSCRLRSPFPVCAPDALGIVTVSVSALSFSLSSAIATEIALLVSPALSSAFRSCSCSRRRPRRYRRPSRSRRSPSQSPPCRA